MPDIHEVLDNDGRVKVRRISPTADELAEIEADERIVLAKRIKRDRRDLRDIDQSDIGATLAELVQSVRRLQKAWLGDDDDD